MNEIMQVAPAKVMALQQDTESAFAAIARALAVLNPIAEIAHRSDASEPVDIIPGLSTLLAAAGEAAIALYRDLETAGVITSLSASESTEVTTAGGHGRRYNKVQKAQMLQQLITMRSAGMTQAGVAAKLGCTPALVSAWEKELIATGTIRDPYVRRRSPDSDSVSVSGSKPLRKRNPLGGNNKDWYTSAEKTQMCARIKELRAQGLTQAAIAAELGCSNALVSKWEKEMIATGEIDKPIKVSPGRKRL